MEKVTLEDFVRFIEYAPTCMFEKCLGDREVLLKSGKCYYSPLCYNCRQRNNRILVTKTISFSTESFIDSKKIICTIVPKKEKKRKSDDPIDIESKRRKI